MSEGRFSCTGKSSPEFALMTIGVVFVVELNAGVTRILELANDLQRNL